MINLIEKIKLNKLPEDESFFKCENSFKFKQQALGWTIVKNNEE